MSEPTMTTSESGDRIWKNKAGEYHRLDGPAIEATDGTKHWYQNGIHHRIDGPAIETASGAKYWYQNGLHHRIDGPAVEWADGTKYWYKNGLRHRIDGPAVEWDNGTVIWYIQNCYLGFNINGFWALWDHLNDEECQNVNLHMWLSKLTNV